MQKLRYEPDPHNRLIVTKLPNFRKVLDGTFRVGDNNALSYHVKTPVPSGLGIPHQLKLRGKWSITDTHDLRLTIDKQGRKTFGDKITLKGDIIDVGAHSLSFALVTKTKDKTRSTYVITLDGSWKADKRNRLAFRVNKEKGLHDILTLDGRWELNKDHEIVYRYEKAELVRKKKKTHMLTFRGHWDIKKKGRISYELSKGTDSRFDFTAGAGVLRKNFIKYEVGIGLKRKQDADKNRIKLYGKWKLKPGLGLVFEIQYSNGKTRAIVFGADVRLTRNDTISFDLRNDIEDKDLGLKVELSHKILGGNGRAFLRFLKSKEEAVVHIGAACRW